MIRKDSATLIDDIFINMLDGKLKSGLIVVDVCDHLLVFAVLETNNEQTLRIDSLMNNFVRIKTPETRWLLWQILQITIGRRFM